VKVWHPSQKHGFCLRAQEFQPALLPNWSKPRYCTRAIPSSLTISHLQNHQQPHHRRTRAPKPQNRTRGGTQQLARQGGIPRHADDVHLYPIRERDTHVARMRILFQLETLSSSSQLKAGRNGIGNGNAAFVTTAERHWERTRLLGPAERHNYSISDPFRGSRRL
jgi:hypothetical protein